MALNEATLGSTMCSIIQTGHHVSLKGLGTEQPKECRIQLKTCLEAAIHLLERVQRVHFIIKGALQESKLLPAT